MVSYTTILEKNLSIAVPFQSLELQEVTLDILPVPDDDDDDTLVGDEVLYV